MEVGRVSAETLFSTHWHRVREVRPRLADDVVVSRHVYRDRPCWVLQRRATSSFHRLDAASFELVDRLDGQLTVEAIWEQALVGRDKAAPTQDQWIALLAELQAAKLLIIEGRVSAEHLFERREDRRLRERRERRLNPLYLRFALYDPDAWLTRLDPVARALFSRTACVLWLVLMIGGSLSLALGGASLFDTLTSTDFPSSRITLLMLIVYPLLKLVHELGHALAVKRCGGEVHELGVALMVLVPLPYIDASASAFFRDKRQRMLVASAGIVVELGFAAVGAMLWVGTSGLAAELGLALLLTGGASTLLMNGNPLLRFDGYYLLSDAIGIPKLATRSRAAVLSHLRAWLSGSPVRGAVTTDVAERRWLLAYGVLSSIYRTGLLLWIAWWLSGRLLIVGVALALYAVFSSLVLPLVRGLRAVSRDADLQAPRPLLLVSSMPMVLTALVFGMPLPHVDVSRGVVWLPDRAVIRADNQCEITSASVRPGQAVRQGQALFDCLDPEHAMRERELIARAAELDVLLTGFETENPAEHSRLLSESRANEATLAAMRERMANAHRTAALDGRFDMPGSTSLVGRSVARGEIVGYVVPDAELTVRVALEEGAAGRLDRHLRRVEVRIPNAHAGPKVHDTAVLTRTLRASNEVPSAALGTAGGGEHQADPLGDGRQVLASLFDVELAWPEEAEVAPVGSHVDVRFVHPATPLAGRIGDALRRAFGERSET